MRGWSNALRMHPQRAGLPRQQWMNKIIRCQLALGAFSLSASLIPMKTSSFPPQLRCPTKPLVVPSRAPSAGTSRPDKPVLAGGPTRKARTVRHVRSTFHRAPHSLSPAVISVFPTTPEHAHLVTVFLANKTRPHQQPLWPSGKASHSYCVIYSLALYISLVRNAKILGSNPSEGITFCLFREGTYLLTPLASFLLWFYHL